MAQPEHSIDTPVPPLTLRQRLWLFPILARLRKLTIYPFSNLGFTISTAFAIITGVFRENKGRSWSHAAHIAATRYLFSFKWDIPTLRSYVGVTTSQVYQNWARGEKQEVLTDILPEGTKLHWIGPRRDRTQDRVFLFFHGESTLPPCPYFAQINGFVFPNNIVFRRGFQLACATRLFSILARFKERCIHFLR